MILFILSSFSLLKFPIIHPYLFGHPKFHTVIDQKSKGRRQKTGDEGRYLNYIICSLLFVTDHLSSACHDDVSRRSSTCWVEAESDLWGRSSKNEAPDPKSEDGSRKAKTGLLPSVLCLPRRSSKSEDGSAVKESSSFKTFPSGFA